jgi:small subunit ribosomal protein S8
MVGDGTADTAERNERKMNLTDPIADMLTRIRNAIHANKDTVEIPVSKIKVEIVKILQEEGYIRSYELVTSGGHPVIKVALKYGPKRTRVIQHIKRVSKPGLRVYRGAVDVPRVQGGMGIAILTTSQGVMTDRRARMLGIGGEVLCTIA